MDENNDVLPKPRVQKHQPGRLPIRTSKETNLERLANEAENRSAKKEQRYDRDHDILTNR
jgi:hypothetical protein